MNIKCFLVEKTDEEVPTEFGWRPVYKRIDNGELIKTELPVGAMYIIPDDWGCTKGLDGKTLMVVTPGGWWYIDSRASNCGKPNDNVHRCWCRHGEAPMITVDKKGITCSAGAGSIAMGNYHGFLRNGEITNC